MPRWMPSRRQFGRLVSTLEGNFVMIELNGEAQPAIEAFRRRKILVGRQFPSMKNWLRVSIGRPEEIEAFLVGLQTIAPATAKKAA